MRSSIFINKHTCDEVNSCIMHSFELEVKTIEENVQWIGPFINTDDWSIASNPWLDISHHTFSCRMTSEANINITSTIFCMSTKGTTCADSAENRCNGKTKSANIQRVWCQELLDFVKQNVKPIAHWLENERETENGRQQDNYKFWKMVWLIATAITLQRELKGE